MKKALRAALITVLLLLALLRLAPAFLDWQNKSVQVTHYTVSSAEIPPAFDGYRILLLADIQGFAVDSSRMEELLSEQNGDLMVLAGDVVDNGIAQSEDVIFRFLQQWGGKLPIYAVSGNHDLWTEGFTELKEQWEQGGAVRFLENQQTVLEKDGQQIMLYGIADPDVWDWDQAAERVKQAEESLALQPDCFGILLFHRANMLDLLQNDAFDLILSGHMHGGQIRLPFVGGLRSPHGDWFPEYSGGKYQRNGQTMIVSRGLGNTVRVPRLFNRPELVVITLQTEE